MKSIQVSNRYILREDGKVFYVNGEEFIPSSLSNGYYRLKINGKRKYLHQWIMEYFGEPCPGPGFEIDHCDKNRLNNDINNLRWVTSQENQNNRTNNRPVGKRLCDYNDINEYKREYKREKRLAAHKV